MGVCQLTDPPPPPPTIGLDKQKKFNIFSVNFNICFGCTKKRSQGDLSFEYSKTCVKGPLKNRQNKDLNDKW